MRANEINRIMQRRAEDLFHAWAKLPGYEPLDEDLVFNLVSRIREELVRAYLDGWYEIKPDINRKETL